jgi:quercetin dioxygenase-like cupin family protein
LAPTRGRRRNDRVGPTAKEITVEKQSLTALARTQLEAARSSSNGRSARTVYGGHEHQLRQTVIALVADRALDEHESPGEATLHVLEGRLRLIAGDDSWVGAPGDLLTIPARRHRVEADQDSAFLLTVVKNGRA